MTYLDLYNKLESVQGLTQWSRFMTTFKIARCSDAIRNEIIHFLESEAPSNYALELHFTDTITGKMRNETITCTMVQEKLGLEPLPALLYMDWLRRDSRRASLFTDKIDAVLLESVEDIRAHIDPELLKKADEVRKNESKKMEDALDVEI